MARKILLADDSVTAQNMGRRILSDAGYEVTTVNNGSAALKKVAEAKPDLIVLDVYMPGYGGLEVCQRLRESEDTARIPVLLTVGKLEPFKVEEVRRVRADAFIIKPFEASELLTALTKLEDRIVPQPQARKPGHSAKTNASVDDFMGTAREYGDTETGWKNRLRIPPPHRKGEPEPRALEIERFGDVPPAPHQKQEEAHSEAGKEEARKTEPRAEQVEAKLVETRAIGLPSDITLEEIAALQAAAEAFRTPPEAKQGEPENASERHGEEPKEKLAESEMAAAPAVSEVRTETTAPALPEADRAATPDAAAVPVPAATASPAETRTETPASVEAASVSEVTAPAAQEQKPTEQAASEQKKLAEHEVAAVLASLEFVNGTSGASESEADEPLFATIAAAQVKEEISGPRWVASSVPVSDQEAALILEEEMQKALAAMAEISLAEAAAKPATATAESTEPVQAAANESPAAKIEEPTIAAAERSLEAAPPAISSTEAMSTPATTEQVVVQEQAAYAAAASAGSSSGEASISGEAITASTMAEAAPAGESVEPQRDSDLASAWASWKQIRESVVTPQSVSEVAEVATSLPSSESASAETTSAEPASSDPSQPETTVEAEQAAANNGEDSEAIANIVDTVLSELKPKLMKEIAKKMGKEKKKR